MTRPAVDLTDEQREQLLANVAELHTALTCARYSFGGRPFRSVRHPGRVIRFRKYGTAAR